jgi:Skp family chaperone for outer membrane proteins
MNAMNRKVWLAILLPITCVVALGWQPGDGDAFRVGFVAIERVIDEYRKNADLSENLQKEFDRGMAELDKEGERIKMAKEELQLLARDSEKYRTLRQTIQIDEFRLELRQKEMIRSLEEKKMSGWKELYADITETAEGVAKDRGLAAVLIVNRSPLEGASDQEITGQISLRQVLYADARYDVTEDVLKRLNR